MRPPEGRSSADAGRAGARAGRQGRVRDRRLERPRTTNESRRQRLVFIVIGGIIAVVIGVIAFGYRVKAAQVRDTVYTQGDLVKRLRLIRATTGSLDLTRAPFEVLFGMVEAELIRQGAEFEGVVVTDEDVDAALRNVFFPQIPEGQEVEPGQLETEYQERYQSFLNNSQISDKEYRVLVSDRVYRFALREKLGEKITEQQVDQAEVSWIRLPYDFADPENPPDPPSVIQERLETGEEFSAVAREASIDPFATAGDGYVGWIPKGLFPDLDATLFGTEDKEALAVGAVSDPISGEDATYIIKLESPVDVRKVEDRWVERLKEQTLQNWIAEQRALGVQGGWVQVNTNSDLYSWVIRELNKSASP